MSCQLQKVVTNKYNRCSTLLLVYTVLTYRMLLVDVLQQVVEGFLRYVALPTAPRPCDCCIRIGLPCHVPAAKWQRTFGPCVLLIMRVEMRVRYVKYLQLWCSLLLECSKLKSITVFRIE